MQSFSHAVIQPSIRTYTHTHSTPLHSTPLAPLHSLHSRIHPPPHTTHTPPTLHPHTLHSTPLFLHYALLDINFTLSVCMTAIDHPRSVGRSVGRSVRPSVRPWNHPPHYPHPQPHLSLFLFHVSTCLFSSISSVKKKGEGW